MTDKPHPDEIQAGEIVISSASRRYMWRDVGLFMVVVMVAFIAFLGWRTDSEHKKALAAQAKQSKAAIDAFSADIASFKKSMEALQLEIHSVKKSSIDVTAVKDMASKLQKLTKAIERLEKQKSEK